MGANSTNLEFVNQRVIDYPRALVFKALSDPKHLAKWWGPKGFTNTFEVFDFRPGGEWKFVMHGPDGTHYPNYSVFTEIQPQQKVVFDHRCAPEFQASIQLEDTGGKTKVTFRMLCASGKVYQSLKGFVPEKNEENFDRLETELKQMSLGSR